MATLKKKKKSEEVVEETVETTVAPEDEAGDEYMNEAEREVLEADGEQYKDEQSQVSSEKMKKVLELLQDKFNLRDQNFELIGYADKGNKIVATLSNAEYEATFTLKSSEVIMRLNMS